MAQLFAVMASFLGDWTRWRKERQLLAWLIAWSVAALGAGEVLLLVVQTIGTLGSWLETQKVGDVLPPSEDAHLPPFEAQPVTSS